MSIINEALKKTQSILSQQKNMVNPTQKDPWINAAMLIIVGGFLGCAIVFGTLILSNNDTLPIEPSKDTGIIADSLPPLTQNATVKKQPVSSSGLNLNGIMQSGDHYIALINNKIVRQGDAVGDKKVLNIRESSVKIFDNGEVFILKLNP